jgi:hypothetical protein
MSQRYQGGFITASYNGLKLPDAPTIGTATAGNLSASVTFTAPSNVGGGAITSYTAIATPGGATGTGAASPVTVSGLSNGTAYTLQVLATNIYGSGPLSAASNSVTPSAPSIEYLVVAGGGGGSGGGGGAGGMLTGTAALTGSYTVTVGAGGALNAQVTANASPGANSVLTGYTAIGGGYGAGAYTLSNGGNGGSGGGGSLGSGSTGTATGGTATSGQGSAGGNATAGSYYGWVGAGGGGAGAVGGSASNYDTGASPPYGALGGAGASSSITGSAVTYAAGAQAYFSSTVSADGTANSGNGGGGSRTANSGSNGWNGGSGVVVIAYPNTLPALTIGGGLTYDQPTRSGYRVYRFTAGTGTITF